MKTAAITGLVAGLAATAISQPIPDASVRDVKNPCASDFLATAGDIPIPGHLRSNKPVSAECWSAIANLRPNDIARRSRSLRAEKRDAEPSESDSKYATGLTKSQANAAAKDAIKQAGKALLRAHLQAKKAKLEAGPLESGSHALVLNKRQQGMTGNLTPQQAQGFWNAFSSMVENGAAGGTGGSSLVSLSGGHKSKKRDASPSDSEGPSEAVRAALKAAAEAIAKANGMLPFGRGNIIGDIVRSGGGNGKMRKLRQRDANPSDSESNASAFSKMLDQFNQLQQQTMTENMEMQKAQAFWNPLESMSKKDATSKRSIKPQKREASPSDSESAAAAAAGTANSSNADAFNTLLQQFHKLQQQTMTENLEMQKAQAFWNPLESMSKKDATSKRSTKVQRREASPSDTESAAGAANSSHASTFSNMLDQYNQLQQQTMLENLEMQKAQAFWNPLESMSKKDATSKRSISTQKREATPDNADSFNTLLQQFNELQQQTMTENLEMQKAQAFWNPLESMSKKDATSKRDLESTGDVYAKSYPTTVKQLAAEARARRKAKQLEQQPSMEGFPSNLEDFPTFTYSPSTINKREAEAVAVAAAEALGTGKGKHVGPGRTPIWPQKREFLIPKSEGDSDDDDDDEEEEALLMKRGFFGKILKKIIGGALHKGSDSEPTVTDGPPVYELSDRSVDYETDGQLIILPREINGKPTTHIGIPSIDLSSIDLSSMYIPKTTVDKDGDRISKIWIDGTTPEVQEQINNHLAWSAIQSEKKNAKRQAFDIDLSGLDLSSIYIPKTTVQKNGQGKTDAVWIEGTPPETQAQINHYIDLYSN